MSNSDVIHHLPLRVLAADEGTEIFLINSRFQRLASAVGELHAEVEPGLYKVRFRAGEIMVDQLLEVPSQLPAGQSEVLVTGLVLPFASALPLPDTRTTRDYHQAAWRIAFDPPELSLGAGSLLFVLARDAEKKPGKQRQHVPWRGLSLCTQEGRVLLDFEESPHRNVDLGFAAANLELDPGTYVLRVDTNLVGVLEMPIVTCSGWQTQVALCSRSISRRASSLLEQKTVGRSRSVRRSDLASATVLMARPGYRADPSGRQERLTELARLGLAQGRSPIRREDLSSMMWAKYENPMLGIYGAHLLLQSGGDSVMDLLSEVVGNLESLAGGHPDVSALRLALERRAGRAVPMDLNFASPPMLDCSWKLVVEASLQRPDLVPDSSFSARIAAYLVNGGPWLIWRRTRDLTLAQRQEDRAVAVTDGMTDGAPIGMKLFKNLHRAIGAGPFGDARLLSGREGYSDIALLSAGGTPHADSMAKRADPVDLLPAIFEIVAEHFPLSSAENLAHLPKNLSSLQQALLHELSATAGKPPQERVSWILRNLGVPPATLLSTLSRLVEGKGRSMIEKGRS